MTKRGNYRSIHVSLVDDPDFQDLSPNARLVLFVLKMSLGPSGIGVLYKGTVSARTGLEEDEVSARFTELIEANWFTCERNIYWLRNGLRFEPKLSLTNENHVENIVKHLKSLPKLRIVQKYCDYYGIDNPFGDGIPYGIDNETEMIPEQEKGERRKEKGERRKDDGEASSPGRSSTRKKKKYVFEEKSVPAELLAVKGFVTAWQEWIVWRETEKRKPVTPLSAKRQLAFLSEQPNPVECIMVAIRNEWQGLYEINSGNTGRAKTGSNGAYDDIDKELTK